MSFFQRLGGSDSESESEDEESLASGSGSEDEQPVRATGGAKNKASMFLRSGSEGEDDSDEESEEEESDEDEDELSDEEQGGRQTLANRFLHGAASSDEDSDDEDKTILMSAKDKRFAEMDAAINAIHNATRNADGSRNDWVLAAGELDKLLRFMSRHQVSMTSSAIPPAGHIPPQFLQTVTELETSVNETTAAEKSATKKMAAPKSKALNGIRQLLRKKVKEYETVLAAYNAGPEQYTSEYEKANAVPAPAKPVAARVRDAQGDEAAAGGDDFMTIGRGGRTMNLTPEGVFKTLKDIVEQRGRKNTDRAETIRILQRLLEVSVTTYQKIRVYLALVPARLDYSQNLLSIPHDSWVSCLGEFDALIQLLLDNPDYVVQEQTEQYDDMVDRAPETVNGKTSRVQVAGGLVGMLENIDNEFTKTLQHTDAQEKGAEYIDRLRSELPLYATIAKAQALFERENWSDQIVRAVMRRVEHVYAKPDAIIDHFEAGVSRACGGLQSRITPFGTVPNATSLIRTLCVYIYQSQAPLLRARAILAHIFNHAMHGRFHQARDLLLMSHLQDTVQHADVTTQILYNRAVVELGLAAFVRGYIVECESIMAEMFSTQRQRELLAQAVQRHTKDSMTPEQELVEKRRLLPFHMHLNIELLEAAYLTSCMLNQIPLLAAVDTEDQRRRVTSKLFKRLLDTADKSAFMGPPEHTRDHVIKASKLLQQGEWESAREMILSIKVWSLLDNAEEVNTMLAKKIQEEGLRTYLYTYASNYASLSLDHLSTTFALSRPQVTAIISRMIYTDELPASLDPIDGVVVFHTVEQSEVQRLAQQLAERAVYMVEQNEKTLDQKLGTQQAQGATGGATGGQQQGGRTRTGGAGRTRGGGRGGRGFQSGALGRRVAA